MTSTRPAPTVWAALGGMLLAVGAVASAALGAALPPEPIDVIGRTGVQAIVWPLSPVLLAACVPASLEWRHRPQERTAGRPALHLSGVHLTLVLVAIAVALTTAPLEHRGVIVRNLAVLVGVAWVSVAALPPRAAWAPVVSLAMVTWLFGTDDAGQPHGWAVLLAPASSESARWCATVVLGVGATAMATGRR